MRFYYEWDDLTEIYYIIDRKTESHICDCYSLKNVQMILIALNDIMDWRG